MSFEAITKELRRSLHHQAPLASPPHLFQVSLALTTHCHVFCFGSFSYFLCLWSSYYTNPFSTKLLKLPLFFVFEDHRNAKGAHSQHCQTLPINFSFFSFFKCLLLAHPFVFYYFVIVVVKVVTRSKVVTILLVVLVCKGRVNSKEFINILLFLFCFILIFWQLQPSCHLGL